MKIVEAKNTKSCKIDRLIVYFLIYSFIGWCIEVTYYFCVKGYYVSRGFLVGPFCCIYGCGGLLIVLFLKRFKHNPVILFVSAAAVTSALEYITGYLLEKFFNNKWWDYSEQPLNLSGYICIKNSLYWGIAAVILLYFIHPFIRFAATAFLYYSKPFIIYIIIFYFVSDIIISSAAASSSTIQTFKLDLLVQGIKSLVNYVENATLKSIESIRIGVLTLKA
jgi:uncharacterized membrane protein